MIKIGINGFGRIGRALTRINLKHQKFQIIAINDIDNDINNLAYLLKYDSTYGKLQEEKVDVSDDKLIINEQETKIFSKKNITDIPWVELGVDIVIDSSGVFQNVIDAHKLIKKGLKKVIVTHSPKSGIDFTFMNGVNDKQYKKDIHHVISSSICDANAVAPFYKLIDNNFGIELGEITTLHPWLSYQNLVDGTIKSVSSPGHNWNDYALGRSSVGSLIPKETSLCNAVDAVMPNFSEKVHSTSFRTPTSIVSAADGVFLLKKTTSIKDIYIAINEYCKKYPNVLFLDNRSLVSIDYLSNENAAVIDSRWLNLNKNKMLKFVLWYDNEWGYTSRVYNLINKI